MIHLGDISAVRADPVEGATYYTVVRNGQNYTARVVDDEINQYPSQPPSAGWQMFLRNAIETRLQGAPDAEALGGKPAADPQVRPW